MTGPGCPGCGALLAVPAGSGSGGGAPPPRYCRQCGLEVRPPCPACGGEPRWLAGLAAGAASPWCAACERLLDACERCRRWLLPGTPGCPDPRCGGRVQPVLPQHTGRRWDLRGTGAGWTWPARWERGHPEHRPPAAARWESPEPVHAAFAAHGRVHVWAGTNLIGLEPGLAAEVWRSPLGPGAVPCPLPRAADRAAVVGGRAVLALDRGFLAVGLRHAGDTLMLPCGAPAAQAGGPGWWVGWGVEPGLWSARVEAAGETLEPRRLETAPDSALARDARIALLEDRAWWPAGDGSVWQADLPAGLTRRILSPPAGGGQPAVQVWAEAGAPRAVREAARQLTACIGDPTAGGVSREGGGAAVPAGMGPLRGVYSCGGQVCVVGERIAVLSARTGELLHQAIRPAGQWIDGSMVPCSDGEPRLLALTVETGFAALTMVRPASGAQEQIWREAGLRPLALLPVSGGLYVAHSAGLAVLR